MFSIIWMPEAEKEYFSNLEYWIDHNKSEKYSLKIIDEVEKIEDLLMANPYIGKITNFELEVLKVIILKRFYLYYTIVENTVNIIAFKATKEDHSKHNLGI
jgi:hypothetical protein